MIRQLNFLLTLTIVSALLFTGCGPSKSTEESVTEAPENLIGTWRLSQRIDHIANKTEWEDVTDSIVYDKYLTDTHFTWINYDKNNDVLTGMGGGTYTFDGENYVEKIEFFLPPTSSILGQEIYFTATFKDGNWYHNGYIMEMEFDPESAETVVVDSSRIEEIWEKVQGTSEGAATVQGTWSLQSYKDGDGGIDLTYPDFVNYIKLITPTHFIWIQYNDEGDVVSGAGSGSYKYIDGQYTETIQMMYPSGNLLTGGAVTFSCEISDNKWEHAAQSFQQSGQETDTIFISEKWTRLGGI